MIMQNDVDSRDRRPLAACPVCGQAAFRPVREIAGFQVVACVACGLQFSNPQPSDEELGMIYGPDYFLQPDENFGAVDIARMKQATAEIYLDLLASAEVRSGRLLELGCGHGDFLLAASRRGYSVTGVEFSEHACDITREKLGGAGTVLRGEIGILDGQVGGFAAAVACDVIEHVRDPRAFLHAIHRQLDPAGVLFIATPSLDSWSARLLGRRWMEYKPEHLTYFSRCTLSELLRQAGFQIIAHHPGRKKLSFDYVAAHFARFPVSGLSPLIGLLQWLCPRSSRSRLFRVVASGTIIIARKCSP